MEDIRKIESLLRYHYEMRDIVVKTKPETNEAKIVAKNHNLYMVVKKVAGSDGNFDWVMLATARELANDPYQEKQWAIKFRTPEFWRLECMLKSTSTVYEIALGLMTEKYRNAVSTRSNNQKNNGKYYFPFLTYRRHATLYEGILEMQRNMANNKPIEVYLNKDKAEEVARRMLFDDDDSNVVCIDTSGDICMGRTTDEPNKKFFVDRKLTEQFLVRD